MESLTSDDMITVILAELDRKGIAGHHISTMNDFYNFGIKQIVTEIFRINSPPIKQKRVSEEDKSIDTITYSVEFTDAYVKPTTTTRFNTNEEQIITPAMCRLKNANYTCNLYLSLDITVIAKRHDGSEIPLTATLKDVMFGQIPCMVGSNKCCTWGMNKEMLKQIGEDPLAPGGYFIMGGKEWVIDNLENMSNNTFHVFKHDKKYKNEIARGNILSKQGDGFENSYELVLRYLENGQITIQISQLTTAGSNKVIIPFFILLRVLGMTSDRDIFDNIVHGVDNTDQVTRDLKQILAKAFNSYDNEFASIAKETDMEKNVIFLAQKAKKDIKATKMNEEYLRYTTNKFLETIDIYILPHVGKTAESRYKKARFLTHMIRELLVVSMGIQNSTDRDSYKIKRVAAAGISMSKTFKTLFNAHIIKDINSKLKKAIEETSFKDIKLASVINTTVTGIDLLKSMKRAITDGSDKLTIKKQEVKRHMTAQHLHHKNDLNVKSTLNNINAQASKTKQNERADNMRRVHPSYEGFIDVSQSADTGEKVGTVKQMAITASISPNISSKDLKEMINNDLDMIIIDEVIPRDITDKKLTKVFVNGDWLGCCKNARQFVDRYREKRRNGELHFTISIVWELSLQKINFWTDAGRLLRPVIIVYNNEKEYLDSNGEVQFEQYIKFTPEHAQQLRDKKITIDDLRKDKIIEYISCDEQVFICENIKTFLKNKNNPEMVYTHCDIDQSILGMVTLASPLGNHSNAVRNTMYTNHRKQSCGWYALNYPDRMDKGVSLQHYCQKPIVSTLSDQYISYPNGQIPMVALQLYNGWGQEDSIIVNRNSIHTGMFSVSFYDYYEGTLERGDRFGIDQHTIIDNQKNYNKLDGNFIAEGETVKKGDVLIAISAKLAKESSDYTHTDKSVAYTKNDETWYVDSRVIPETDNDISIAKIKLRAERPLNVGDKLSSRTGNKGIVSKLVCREDMPYSEHGLVPDLIVNPHSIPTRMASNQIIESLLGWLALVTGKVIDATIFKEMDIDSICEMLKEYGFTSNGYHTMYDGKTGKKIDVEIFIGPTTYQRLQKFIQDEHYAVWKGPINTLTRQPLSGKSNNGGLKIGEMENWVLAATGSMQFMYEKLYKDSDGIMLHICTICGDRAVVNEEKNLYLCKNCKDDADIRTINSSWMANVVFDELNAMNVKIKTFPKPYEFVDYEQ